MSKYCMSLCTRGAHSPIPQATARRGAGMPYNWALARRWFGEWPFALCRWCQICRPCHPRRCHWLVWSWRVASWEWTGIIFGEVSGWIQVTAKVLNFETLESKRDWEVNYIYIYLTNRQTNRLINIISPHNIRGHCFPLFLKFDLSIFSWNEQHRLGTLVQELGRPVPELKKVTSRSKAMAACYPGNGARYVKHVDNDENHALCRTRVLTALIYLNDWQKGDGGELALFQADDPNQLRRTVTPVQNRLLLFWSDRRTPHEVLPSEKLRYSVTVWLLDNTKKIQAWSVKGSQQLYTLYDSMCFTSLPGFPGKCL